MCALGRWTIRVSSHLSDEAGLGRWAWLLIPGCQQKQLLAVTSYRVCRDTDPKSHTTTAFGQQWHHLRQGGIAGTKPRRQCSLDVARFLMDSSPITLVLSSSLMSTKPFFPDPHPDSFFNMMTEFNLNDVLTIRQTDQKEDNSTYLIGKR